MHAFVSRSFIVLVMFALVSGRPIEAQERPAPAAEFTAGWVGFADDGIVSETMIGGSARWYVSPRVSLGPELAYIHGEDHHHLVVTGNLVLDLLGPASGQPRAVTPFVVIGGGIFRTSETFFGDAVSSNEGAFTAGGGVRASVGERVTAGVEARLGWETHLRINGTVGVRFGR